MKIPTATWVSFVAIVLVAGFVLNSADLILVSILAGAIGFGARSAIALRDHREAKSYLKSDETRIQVVERRLHLAEQALISTREELERRKPGGVADPQ